MNIWQHVSRVALVLAETADAVQHAQRVVAADALNHVEEAALGVLAAVVLKVKVVHHAVDVVMPVVAIHAVQIVPMDAVLVVPVGVLEVVPVVVVHVRIVVVQTHAEITVPVTTAVRNAVHNVVPSVMVAVVEGVVIAALADAKVDVREDAPAVAIAVDNVVQHAHLDVKAHAIKYAQMIAPEVVKLHVIQDAILLVKIHALAHVPEHVRRTVHPVQVVVAHV